MCSHRTSLPPSGIDQRNSAPKTADEVDRRVVASPRQVDHLLAAVAKVRPELVAFFACLYYAFLRPAEAAALTIDSCELPAKRWGRLTLTGSAKRVGAAWTDDGAAVDQRQLKHRARDAVASSPSRRCSSRSCATTSSASAPPPTGGSSRSPGDNAAKAAC